MRKAIVMVVLGIGGLAAAIALTVGALALAGDEVGNVVQPTIVASESRSLASPSEVADDPSSTPSPAADDHGGDAGSDDNSGPGSDNSGPGSDDPLDDD